MKNIKINQTNIEKIGHKVVNIRMKELMSGLYDIKYILGKITKQNPIQGIHADLQLAISINSASNGA